MVRIAPGVPSGLAVSEEDRGLIDYLQYVDGIVTSTTNHSLFSLRGFISNHRKPGTNGIGLAIDIAGLRGGRDTVEHATIFHAFRPVEHLLHELIYAGPQVTYNIKAGARVGKYAQASHHDHVHAAVPRGTILYKKELGPMGFPNAIHACLCPTGGTWTVGTDGGVFPSGGAPFLGSYPGLPPAARQGTRRFLAIEATMTGYAIIADDGNAYRFPV